MKITHVFYPLLFIFILFACNSGEDERVESLTMTDLSRYGVPVSIPLPVRNNVTQSPISFEKGVVISGDKVNMRVEALQTYAESLKNAQELKKKIIAEKKEETDFVKLLIEDEQGFIYQTKDSELGNNFHFFYVIIKNNTQVEFTEGVPIDENFTYEDIVNMYGLSKRCL